MPTLNRDIQQLDLGSNRIANLQDSEFTVKKFKNLQKIYLNKNQLLQVHAGAFHKLTGLVELDLSDNLMPDLGPADITNHHQQQITSNDDENRAEQQQLNTKTNRSSSSSKQQKTEKKVKNYSSKTINLRAQKSTFLSDLTQLRQLSLASNQLTKLEEFAFSPAKQLRQLYLSR